MCENPFWNSNNKSIIEAYGMWYERHNYFLKEYGKEYYELKECGELNKLSNKIGIMVAMPYRRKYDKNKIENELKNPTDMEDTMDWYLETAKNTRNSYRDRSTSELLFCMLRSKK